jgi:hypothetical protein
MIALRSCVFLILFLSWFAPARAAATAPAEIVSAPDWRIGSTWEYSDGYVLRVRANDGQVATFDRVDAPGQWFSMRGFLRQDATSGTAVRRTIYRTIDPDAGRILSSAKPLTFQREYLSGNQLIVHASSWTVEGRQRITVPAGTFDCWIIVFRTRSLQSNWTGFERWWYSPEAQNYVRMEYKYGPTTTSSRVLMRYSVPAAAPAIAVPAMEPATPPAAAAAPVPAPVIAPSAAAPAPQRASPSSAVVPAAAPTPNASVPAVSPAPSVPSLSPGPPPRTVIAPPPVEIADVVQTAELRASYSTADVFAGNAEPTDVFAQESGEREMFVINPPPPLAPQELFALSEEAILHAALQSLSPLSGDFMVEAPAAPLVQVSLDFPTPKRKPAVAIVRKPRRAWVVQIDSFKNPENAQRRLALVRRRRDDDGEDIESGIELAVLGGRGTFHRVWVGSFETEAGAQELCRAMRADGTSTTCFVRLRSIPAEQLHVATASE